MISIMTFVIRSISGQVLPQLSDNHLISLSLLSQFYDLGLQLFNYFLKVPPFILLEKYYLLLHAAKYLVIFLNDQTITLISKVNSLFIFQISYCAFYNYLFKKAVVTLLGCLRSFIKFMILSSASTKSFSIVVMAIYNSQFFLTSSSFSACKLCSTSLVFSKIELYTEFYYFSSRIFKCLFSKQVFFSRNQMLIGY